MVVESLLLFFCTYYPKICMHFYLDCCCYIPTAVYFKIYALLKNILMLQMSSILFADTFPAIAFFLRQIGVKKLFHLFAFLTIWYEENVIVPFHISTQTSTQKFVKCCWWCTQNLRCIILCKEEQSRSW